MNPYPQTMCILLSALALAIPAAGLLTHNSSKAGAPEQKREAPVNHSGSSKPGSFTNKLRKHKKTVYLTFDGGPSAGFSEKAIPIFRKHNCKVTFFVVGEYLDRDRKASAQLSRDGHEIENHTFSHPHLKKLTDSQIRYEIRKTADLVERQVGSRPVFLRPPYGQHDKRVDRIAAEEGHAISLWNVTCLDYKIRDLEEITIQISSEVKPESVVLLHVSRQTWQALPSLLRRLDEMGFSYGLVKDRPGYRRSLEEARRIQKQYASRPASEQLSFLVSPIACFNQRIQ